MATQKVTPQLFWGKALGVRLGRHGNRISAHYSPYVVFIPLHACVREAVGTALTMSHVVAWGADDGQASYSSPYPTSNSQKATSGARRGPGAAADPDGLTELSTVDVVSDISRGNGLDTAAHEHYFPTVKSSSVSSPPQPRPGGSPPSSRPGKSMIQLAGPSPTAVSPTSPCD